MTSSDIIQGSITPLLLMVKVCKKVIGAQNLLLYFRLHCCIFIRGGGVSCRVKLLTEAL